MPEPQEIPEPNVRKLTLPSPFGTSLLSSASQANTPSPAPVQSFLAQADNSMFVPPDTDGAVGTDKLFTTVNGTYIVEQKSNGAALKALTMATFWGATGAQHPFDPKTFYDPYNGRWLVAAVTAARTRHLSCTASPTPATPREPGTSTTLTRTRRTPRGPTTRASGSTKTTS